MKDYKNVKASDELAEHGKIGTESQTQYDAEAQMLIIGQMLKKARKEAKLTQEQLAKRVRINKSYISKLENGKQNIQLSTLIRIFEQGLNRKVGVKFL